MGVLNPLDTFVQLLCPTEIRNWTKVVQKVMQRNFVVKMNQLTAKFRIGYYLSQSHWSPSFGKVLNPSAFINKQFQQVAIFI